MTTSRLALAAAASLILATSAVADTLTFQQGDGGAYSTTDATTINSETAVNFAASSVLTVTAGTVQALIRFPGIFGSNPGQIPPGSTIISASLTVTMYGTPNIVTTTNIHEVYVDWDESTVTGVGFYALPGPHYGPAVGSIPPSAPLEFTSGDMTSIVQHWSDGAANRGVMLRTEVPPPPDDLYITQYYSENAPDPYWHPMLTVEFTAPQLAVEPTTWGKVKALYR
jgi:hypothetical protein